MQQLFIAYANADRDFAARLCAALDSPEYKIWDWQENLPASDWGRIFPAIESSSAFLFVISPASVTSATCLQELKYGADLGKRVIPVLRENVPTELLPSAVAQAQWILALDDREFGSAVEAIRQALELDVDALSHETRLLARSLDWERHNHHPSLLLSSVELKEAKELASRAHVPLASVILEYVKRSDRAIRQRVIGVTVVAVLTGSALVASTAFNLLPLGVAVGFLSGVIAAALALKNMGYSRQLVVTPTAVATSPDTPDTLGPQTIFLSYGRNDWDRYAKIMVERLRAAQLTVWVDQQYIDGGDDWMDAIDLALKTCQRMVLCVTPDAVKSKYVRKEYRYFIKNDKPIYPILCEQSELPFELEGIQQLAFTDAPATIAAIRRGRLPAITPN
ncbi:MAG TPA: toll/interleukin-1 receptor domain-containing protein [Vicinamibacterales bacterium]|nr:toll/interleukin-1 receptor domain-containing protein [Vicinamibacterales bacterium]